MKSMEITQRQIFTKAERIHFFSVLETLQQLIFCRLGFYAGLRISEILKVCPKDLIFNDGAPVVHVRESKREKSRFACVDMGTYCLIKTFASDNQILPDQAVINDSPRTWQRNFKRLTVKAGLVRIDPTPHSMRHSNITMLLQLGMDIEKVAKHAGHADISTTMEYEHLTYEFTAKRYHNLVGE